MKTMMPTLQVGMGSLAGVGGRKVCSGEVGYSSPSPTADPSVWGQKVLPSFLQREGWLFQVQARMVARSRKETSGSRMASTSMVPARTADRGVMAAPIRAGLGRLRRNASSLGNTDREKGVDFPFLATLQLLKAEGEKLPLDYREGELSWTWEDLLTARRDSIIDGHVWGRYRCPPGQRPGLGSPVGEGWELGHLGFKGWKREWEAAGEGGTWGL